MALGFGDLEAILGGGRVGPVQREGLGLEVDGDLGAARLRPAAAIACQSAPGSSIGSRPLL